MVIHDVMNTKVKKVSQLKVKLLAMFTAGDRVEA